MVSYHKQKAKWEREYHAAKRAGGPTLDFKPNRSGEWTIPRKGSSGVPNSGKSQVHYPMPSTVNKPYKYYHEAGGPKGNWWGKIPRYKGIARGAFGFIMDNADELSKWNEDAWDRWMNGDTPTLEEAVGKPYFDFGAWGTPIPTDPGETKAPDYKLADTLDGFDYYVDGLAGWNVGCNVPGWYPGQTGAGATYVMKGSGHYQAGEPCSISYSNIGPQAPNAGPDATGKRWGLWSNRDNRPNGALRFIGWGNSGWSPGNPYPRVIVVPKGSPTPEIVVGPKRFSFMPGAAFSGYQAPDPRHVNVPNRIRAAVKAAALLTGTRIDPGYNPSDPPAVEPSQQVVAVIPPGGNGTIARPTNPDPPYNPGGMRDRKMRLKGLATFQYIQKVFHGITEVGDITGAIYDALPKKYQTCKYGGPACEAYMIAKHFDKIDIVEAVVNVIANDIEDRLLGRFFGWQERTARGIGSHGYKIMNGAADSGLDAELGNLYGEFAKEHVAPKKAEIVRRVKQILGVEP